jgi:hypothetical protein
MNKTYKKYDDHIKQLIINTGNPCAFPELGIPRTTALYWINKSKKKFTITNITIETSLKKRIKALEDELHKERAKYLFLREIIFKLNGLTALYTDKKNKEFIVQTILKYKHWISTNKLCNIIKLGPSKFYRFKLETIGCERIGFKKCRIQSRNQLSFKEQKVIYDLANNPTLFHLSIKKLQYYAFRKGLLTCGYNTWRKYVAIFNPNRTKIKRKRKKERQGIRASIPNEIWHMDITEFKLIGHKKVYLQVIVDNFSRKVVYWTLSRVKDQDNSIKTIELATKLMVPTIMMTDGGGENIGLRLKGLYHGCKIKRLIAKHDTTFSNSMVESFFNILKKRYIKKQKYYTFSRLYNKVRRSVDSYNNLPLPLFSGGTPTEMYVGDVVVDDMKELFSKELNIAYRQRIKDNNSCLNNQVC